MLKDIVGLVHSHTLCTVYVCKLICELVFTNAFIPHCFMCMLNLF